jgi:conflict system STAND superfamily ATPase
VNAAPDTAVDARSPWLGLASFTEETRAYFFGREEEVAELARRVQRKLLTVLFGQSGLGKTSILRAGLVPKLRSQGYCPVYVRVDYSAESPEPGEQIKRAIAQTARRSGEWTQSGVAAAGESLWEFLHHRGDVLQDDSGSTLIPLLIFDQFEEIFTLAQSDDAGRARAARFIEDLADLVENRSPRELEARLETDEEAAGRFDFARSDYRVLIALREDYLAPLESLKRSMPSIAQNRLRLAPMTGAQALAAVLKPGKGLVNEEVASAIVRFVAGGAEIQNAEVEPALLSLVCRELNDARLAQGKNEISSDLLDGSQNTILSNFYERSLADQPPAVRCIVEDQLLTASGFRENIAEERLVAAFKSAGIAQEALPVLVNRRLLRIEERLDVRRVELTHDVLCGVVKASRDLRQEREAHERTDRLLAEQRDKEAAARHSLMRARQVAAVCALLALMAVVAAVIAVFSTQRARRAEAATQQARVQAEGLVGYLSDDFSRELQTYGQQATISEIGRRQIDYFRGLPPSLKGVESIRTGALAMINYARAERSLGHLQPAAESAREAIALLEQARNDGDRSDATTIALARAYDSLAGVMSANADPKALATAKKSVSLIEPLAMAPDAPLPARRSYAYSLIALGFQQGQYRKEFEDGAQNLKHAREIAASLGGREIKTPEIGAMYVAAAVWEAEILARLGREEEALAIDMEADQLARRILEKRPDYLGALHDAQIIEVDLANLAASQLDPAKAIRFAKAAWVISQNLLQRDPNSSSAINNASANLQDLADQSWATGDVTGSHEYARQAEEIYHRLERNGAWFVLNALTAVGSEGQRLADAGLDAEARKKGEFAEHAVDSLKDADAATLRRPFTECALLFAQASISMGLGDFRNVQAKASKARQLVQGVEPSAAYEGLMKYNCDFDAPLTQGEAELWLGENAAALDTLQALAGARGKYPPGGLDAVRSVSVNKVLEAMAFARLGRLAEAHALIEPEVKFQRELAARNKGDVTQFMNLAETLYVESLTDASHSVALRREALGLIAKLPPQFHKLRSVTRWRQLIQAG